MYVCIQIKDGPASYYVENIERIGRYRSDYPRNMRCKHSLKWKTLISFRGNTSYLLLLQPPERFKRATSDKNTNISYPVLQILRRHFNLRIKKPLSIMLIQTPACGSNPNSEILYKTKYERKIFFGACLSLSVNKIAMKSFLNISSFRVDLKCSSQHLQTKLT